MGDDDPAPLRQERRSLTVDNKSKLEETMGGNAPFARGQRT